MMNPQHTPADSRLSPYLQTLVQEGPLLDITNLQGSAEGAFWAYSWLDDLLHKRALRMEINASHDTQETLKSLFFEYRNAERLQGVKTLGFAYPFLVLHTEAGICTAPLVIWPVQLEPDTQTANHWWLSYSPDYLPTVNKPLLYWLKSQCGWEENSEWLSLVQPDAMTSGALAAFCDKLATHLNINNPSQSASIMPCPDRKALLESRQPDAIYWSGVVGIFPAVTEEADPAAWQEAAKLSAAPKGDHPFGVSVLDPWQATAVEAVQQGGPLLVTGSSGSGKTHLALHLLTSTLSNGGKCLVVSQSMTALKSIQDQLVALGLERLQWLFRDAVIDKTVLLETLKTLAKTETSALPAFDAAAFRRQVDKALREKGRLDQRYQAVRKKVFGTHDWSETVGLFLSATRREGKELLSSQLNPQDFAFHYEEYLLVKNAVSNCYPLFQRINTLNHPLRNLNAGIFIHKSKEEGLEFIRQKQEEFIAKAQQLQLEYIATYNAYGDQLMNHYEQYYAALQDHNELIHDAIRDHINRFGEVFAHGSPAWSGLRSLFSDKHKEIRQARKSVAGLYKELKTTFSAYKYIDFTFPSWDESSPVKQLEKILEGFEGALRQWRKELTSTVQEELLRLNHKTVNPNVDGHDKVLVIEDNLTALVEELNESGLYQLPFENKMLTVSRQQKYLEDTIDQLEVTRLNLRDYDVFYDWQRNWFQLPENARRVVRALAKVRPPDWVSAFESWYLNNCLAKSYDAVLPLKDFDAKTCVGAIKAVRDMLPAQILHRWQGKKEEALRAAKRAGRNQYEQLFGRRNIESSAGMNLAELLGNGIEAITDLLPVWLTTPQLASKTLPAGEVSFDLLIVEEGHMLNSGAITPLLSMAKQTVVLAHTQLIEENEPLALPTAMRGAKIRETGLEICHHWRPGDLTPLLDPNTQWGATALNAFQLRFEQVEGRYDPQTRTNAAEAQRLIQLLNDIQPTPQRTYPSVGIVCCTTGQRNLIADYLLQIKLRRLPGVEKIQQLERNGLLVYTIDEMPGIHPDILFFSGTFGITGLEGQIEGCEDYYEGEKGLRRLYLLMSRPIKSLYLLNSIPEVLLADWSHIPSLQALYLLSNYYHYAVYVQQSHAKKQDEVVAGLRRGIGIEKQHHTLGFASELALRLEAYIESGRLRLDVPMGEWRFPLLVQQKGDSGEACYLQPDGFFAQAPCTDHVWEMEQRTRLEELRVKTMPVWSAAWWKNAPFETRKLAAALIQVDESKAEEEG
jgi:energy-coupling factor transporter ATP-binding protein EcfA2